MVAAERSRKTARAVKAASPRLEPSELTQRGKRTRAALLSAARTIFERDGFHAARITDIADEAGVAHGTFYTYFDTKEKVFLELLRELQKDLLGWQSKVKADPHTDLSPVERLERSNRQYLQIYRANGRLVAIWEEVAGFNAEAAAMFSVGRVAFVKRSLEYIQRLQKEGLIDPEVNPRYAAHALTGMVSQFARSWIYGGERFSFEEAVEQLTRLWANALGLGSLVAATESNDSTAPNTRSISRI